MADWFRAHPEIELVNRDRAGLYANAARRSMPQARQVADHFHPLKKLRERIEEELGNFEAPVSESREEGDANLETPAEPTVGASRR